MSDERMILEEIKDFRKDVKLDIKELATKIDGQSRKIISAEKDIEYLKLDIDEKHKEFNTFCNTFRDFKDNKLGKLIDNKIENNRNKIGLIMIMKVLFGAGLIIWLGVKEFILGWK